jgi:lipopolysaccharide export system permease protein
VKKLHTFLLKSYFGPFVLTLFITMFILLMQFIWKYIDEIAGKGLEWYVMAELLMHVSARLVPMALPLAVLLSSIMTFGNLGEHFELTAVKSAGVSLQHFMKPLIYVVILISLGAFFYSNRVIPYSNLKVGAILYDLKDMKPEMQIKAGAFYKGIDGFIIKTARKNNETGMMYDLMIYDHRKERGNQSVTVADSGSMRMTPDKSQLILTLYNGATYEERPESKKGRNYDPEYPHQRHFFKEQQQIFELSGFELERSNEALFKDHFQMMNLTQLEARVDTLSKEFNHVAHNFSERTLKRNLFQRDRLVEKEKLPAPRPQKTAQKKRQPQTNNKSIPIAANDTPKITDSVKEKHNNTQLEENPTALTNYTLDSLMGKVKVENRLEVVQQALTYARNAQNAINGKKKTFKYKQGHIRRHQIEWHRKFALSFACLVFFFIGAPFGAIVRKGGLGTPVIISVLFFIVYYIISISSEKFAREGILTPFLGMWMASFILFPIGIFLTYKATTDSVILNTDTYINFIKKQFNKLIKKKSKS